MDRGSLRSLSWDLEETGGGKAIHSWTIADMGTRETSVLVLICCINTHHLKTEDQGLNVAIWQEADWCPCCQSATYRYISP